VGILLQMQFYLTPIVYQTNQVPEYWHGVPLRNIIIYQPLAIFVEIFRSLMYELTLGRGVAWLVAAGWTLLAVGIALVVYRRHGLDLSEEM
jgi:ABC-type polysaccharide/polyol phosphate export permease